MLIASQASFKKVAAYVLVIVFMLSGTAYMVYDNFIKKPAAEAVLSPEFFAGDSAAVNAPAAIPAQSASTSTSTVPAAGKKLSPVLNADVMEDQRFLSLKEIIIKPAENKPGKENPFKPYE
jgi:zona occludens toxin (predicted ATPase)